MVSFSETHEVISTMLWGFVIVIKRNGTDGSTFPMVNEVKQKVVPKSLRVKSDLLRRSSLGQGRAVTSGSSYLKSPRSMRGLKSRPSIRR